MAVVISYLYVVKLQFYYGPRGRVPTTTISNYDLSLSVDDGPFAVLLDPGKVFRETINLVINARYDYLPLGVDKSPFAVLLDTVKAFREPPRLVINARYDYLFLGIDKSPFAVLLDMGKAF